MYPYGTGYMGLQIPRNPYGDIGASLGPLPNANADFPMATTPGAFGLPQGATAGNQGQSASMLGPLSGFAMNMFMNELNKSNRPMYAQMPNLGLRAPQQISLQPPVLYRPIAIGRPYG